MRIYSLEECPRGKYHIFANLITDDAKPIYIRITERLYYIMLHVLHYRYQQQKKG